MTSNKIIWCDEPGGGSSLPYLFLCKGTGEVRLFRGKSIERWCAVVGDSFEKRGRFSNTTWTLALAEGVKAKALTSGVHSQSGLFEQSALDDQRDWLSRQLGVEVCASSFLQLLEAHFPKTLERAMRTEELLDRLHEEHGGAEEKTLSWRGTRRHPHTWVRMAKGDVVEVVPWSEARRGEGLSFGIALTAAQPPQSGWSESFTVWVPDGVEIRLCGNPELEEPETDTATITADESEPTAFELALARKKG